MSLLSTIVDIGKSAWNFVTGDSIGSNLVKTILTGYALNKVSSSINKENQNTSSSSSSTATQPIAGTRLQLQASPENRIPVVYGSAITGGIITDARMASGNQVMHFVLTISEVTGTLMSNGQPSVFSFEDVYWNGNRIIFRPDGITADYMLDPDGNIDRSISGLVKVYCYSNGSNSPAIPDNYTNTDVNPAWVIMPNWTSLHTMSNLVFAIVRVEYSQEKNITGLGQMRFHVNNTMTLPGDCLFDYMTSTRYGAGINPLEIKSA